jgi:hypothetical protein
VAEEFQDDLPLDGEVKVSWTDREPEIGIYRGYLAGFPRRCAIRFGGNLEAVWVDREIISPVAR